MRSGTAGRSPATSWRCSASAGSATSACNTRRRWGSRRWRSRAAATKLGATAYIDSQSRDPAVELTKLGGARIVLATVTNAEAMVACIGGFGAEGKLLVLGVPPGPLPVPAFALINGKRSVAGWYSG